MLTRVRNDDLRVWFGPLVSPVKVWTIPSLLPRLGVPILFLAQAKKLVKPKGMVTVVQKSQQNNEKRQRRHQRTCTHLRSQADALVDRGNKL